MYFEQLNPGQRWSVEPFTVTRQQIIAFSLDYDPLPIHLDEGFAKSTRFGSLIASGPLSFMLFWTRFLRTCPDFSEGLIAGLGNRMVFLAPVRPDDRLHGFVTVSECHERNRYNGAAVFAVEGFNQDGQHVLGGFVEACFAKEAAG
jgi:acyl dehydratase